MQVEGMKKLMDSAEGSNVINDDAINKKKKRFFFF
jgi:hypothetical protein